MLDYQPMSAELNKIAQDLRIIGAETFADKLSSLINEGLADGTLPLTLESSSNSFGSSSIGTDPGDFSMGKIVRTWRKHLNVTQVGLSERIGVRQSQVSDFENARDPKVGMFRKVAKGLGIPPGWLLEGRSPKE